LKEKFTIGISDCAKYTNYEKWFLEDPRVDVVRLGYTFKNAAMIKNCAGLVLSGGQDVHPRFYNKPEFLAYSKPGDIDEQRDEFEMKLLEYAHSRKMPMLGICRGLQIANVFYGGTLVPDIPSFSDADHSKFEEGMDRYHPVKVEAGSTLYGIVRTHEGEINSAHHQGAQKIGEGLTPNSFSPEDGYVEGMENTNRRDRFVLLVQWHPERMANQQSPFASGIRNAFCEAVRLSQQMNGDV